MKKIGVMQWQTKEDQRLPEATGSWRRGMKCILPQRLQNSLVPDCWPPDCERVNFYYVKPPHLQPFVIASLGNQHITLIPQFWIQPRVACGNMGCMFIYLAIKQRLIFILPHLFPPHSQILHVHKPTTHQKIFTDEDSRVKSRHKKHSKQFFSFPV